MSLFNSGTKPINKLVIALKSSSVDVQLVSCSKNNVRTVLFAKRVIIFLGDFKDSTQYTKKCMTELARILKTESVEISKLNAGNKLVTEVILYAPWFTSSIVEKKSKGDVVVSTSFLNEIKSSVATPSKLISLEKEIIKIVANGYVLTKPAKDKLQNAAVQTYYSYISKDIHELVDTTIRHSFALISDINYKTTPLLFFEQIKRTLVQEDNVCFVYIGGEITEVGIIEDDVLSFFGTFPIGKHDFLRELQETISSYDYDLLYQKEIQIKTKKKQEGFENLKLSWQKNLANTLLNSDRINPNKIILISDTKTRDFFTQLASKEINVNNEEFSVHYRIINFDISYLKDIISYKTPTNTNELDLQLEALI